MSMAEIDRPNSLLGPLLDIPEVTHQPADHQPARVRCPTDNLINAGFKEPVIGIVPPLRGSVMAKTLTASGQMCGSLLPIRSISVEEQIAPEPQEEAMPFKVRKLASEAWKTSDQPMVIIMITKQKVEPALGSGDRQVTEPTDRRIDRRLQMQRRPAEVKNVPTKHEVLRSVRCIPESGEMQMAM